MKLWAYLESRPGQEPENWKAWLFRVAVNEKNDFLRKKQRTGIAVDLEEAEALPSRRDSSGVEEKMAVRQAMAGLAREDRELLILKSIGFNSREIGSIQGLPDSTVRSRIALARKHFAEALERWKSERVVLRCQNEERLHWMKALFAQPFEQAFSGRGK